MCRSAVLLMNLREERRQQAVAAHTKEHTALSEQCNHDDGAITEEDMHSMTAGGSLKLTPKSIMNKVCKGIKKFGFLVKFGITALKGMKAQKLAKKIPTVYNEKKINKWQRKLEKKFN